MKKKTVNFSKILSPQMIAVKNNPDPVKCKWVSFITCHKYRVLQRSALKEWLL